MGFDKTILDEKISSGQSRFVNRLSWALSYLSHAGLLRRVGRATYQITDRGKQALQHDKITLEYLNQFEEFRAFRQKKRMEQYMGDEQTIIDEYSQTPQEIIEEQVAILTGDLKSQLREMIISSSPEFFEKLVIDLLLNMGYGGSRQEMAQRLGKTGDEGVDGVIKEDPLGLDAIYIQAKRWKNKSVGRPDVQQFVGALTGKGARKGVFITTSHFTDDARRYVEKINSQKDNTVILIDGDELLDLMIKHDVGVSMYVVYEIKRIDSDYFSDE
jgi:restriction system protein